jgi:hypothetical protein
MSRPKTPDILDQVLAGRTAPEASPHSPSLELGKMMRFSFWIPQGWKAALERHFKAQGSDISHGLRQMIARYLKEQGIG